MVHEKTDKERWLAVWSAIEHTMNGLGLTKQDAYRLSGVSESTFRKIRDGQAVTRPSTIGAIEDGLGWSRGSLTRILAGEPVAHILDPQVDLAILQIGTDTQHHPLGTREEHRAAVIARERRREYFGRPAWPASIWTGPNPVNVRQTESAPTALRSSASSDAQRLPTYDELLLEDVYKRLRLLELDLAEIRQINSELRTEIAAAKRSLKLYAEREDNSNEAQPTMPIGEASGESIPDVTNLRVHRPSADLGAAEMLEAVEPTLLHSGIDNQTEAALKELFSGDGLDLQTEAALKELFSSDGVDLQKITDGFDLEKVAGAFDLQKFTDGFDLEKVAGAFDLQKFTDAIDVHKIAELIGDAAGASVLQANHLTLAAKSGDTDLSPEETTGLTSVLDDVINQQDPDFVPPTED